jgi:hypothetical protein
MTINDYKALPSSVKCIVAVMHTKLHYVVMEITIDTKTIKIFDGLHRPLLDWKDHIIRAMRKYMLVDPFVDADTAVYEIVGRSRKPKECVNGCDIIIAMQKWQLERGYFLHQSDRNNCGPTTCKTDKSKRYTGCFGGSKKSNRTDRIAEKSLLSKLDFNFFPWLISIKRLIMS